MTRYSRYIKLFSAISDLIILNLCFLFVWLFKFGSFYQPFFIMLLYINISWVCLIGAIKPYNVSRTSSYLRVLKFTLTMVICHILLVFAYYVFQQPYRYSRELLLLLYAAFLSSSLAFHTIFFMVLKLARKKGFNYRNIILVVNQDRHDEALNFFRSHPEYGYHVKLIIDPQKQTGEELHKTLADSCAQHDIHELFYSMSAIEQNSLNFLLEFSENNLIKIRFIADFKGIGHQGLELENHDNTVIIKMHATPLDEWDKQLMKRAFDIVFSSFVIIFILSWLIPILAVLIKLTSKGPVFFTQKRTGRDNKPFTCYKLRSMKVNSESDTLQATSNDSRITSIGHFLRKSSFDELPQFFNVLIGNMSVVGPRPHMLKHTEDFTNEISNFMIRHHIKPGITGLAQSKGYRGETPDFEQKNHRVKLDLFYVKNWSFLFDLAIIFDTLTPAQRRR